MIVSLTRYLAIALLILAVPQQQQPLTALDQALDLLRQVRAALTGTGSTIAAHSAAELSNALATAPAGAVIELDSGGNYQGNFAIRRGVTIRTAGVTLPDRGVEDGDVPQFASVCSTNNAPALHLLPGVGLEDVTLARVHWCGPSNSVILIGAGDASQTSLTQVPRRITFDQISVSGVGAKNGIEAQGAEVSITRSLVRDVARNGVESHGFLAYNGPGPFLIERNRFHGSSIGIFFGGAVPPITGLIPADITIRRNVVTKHEAPVNYAPKNAIEWKIGRRILVEENLIDGVRAGGQAGWGIQITPEQRQGAPAWAIVAELTFRRNIVRNVGGVFNILGHGQYQNPAGNPYWPTLVSHDITIADNWLRCDSALGGHGALAQIGNGPVNLVFEANTVECNGTAFLRKSDTTPAPGFRYTSNLQIIAGQYGIFTPTGSMAASGQTATVLAQFPGGVLNGNALIGAPSPFRTALPLNLYIASGDGLVDVDGYSVGAAANYGRRRPQ